MKKRRLPAFRLSLITLVGTVAALSACTGRQDKSPDAKSVFSRQHSIPALGETVSAIDDKYTMALQDKDNNYWFSNGGQGVYRYKSKPGGRATITRFTTKDGLCSDQVGGMAQHAPTGDIVIITSEGFCKFDGRAFSKITVLDPSKSEWKIQPDDLWFSAGQDTGAVFRYDGTVVHRLTFPTTKAGDAHYKELPRDKFPNAKYSPYDVYNIFRDSKGHMWFATATLGACRYDGTTFAWFVKPAVELDNFGTRSIIQDKDGKYLFSSTPNRYTFDPSPQDAMKGSTVEIKYHMEPGFGTAEDPFSVFMSAVKDKNGDLWLCTLGAGVFRYDGTKMTHYPVTHDGAPIWVHTISLDRQDNPWLATTEHGAYKFNGKTFEKFSPEIQDAVVAKGEIVADIGSSCWVGFQDKNNNYWFGSDGNGVCRYDGKTITRFTTKDGLSHDQVRGIQQHASSGDILITTNGGVSKFDGQRFVTLPITEMKPPALPSAAASGALPTGGIGEGWVLNPDDLWLTGAGGPRRYDGKTLYQLKFPRSPLHEELAAPTAHRDDWSPYDVWTVYTDHKGHMWFGTGMLGVCRFDGKHIDWMFERHLTEFENGAWFGFRAIIEDRNGDFWFNCTLHRYKVEPHGVAGQETGKLKYMRDQGMDLSAVDTTDKFIFYQSITEDNNRDLWMAPYAGGVWKYDGKNVTHYPMKDGENNEITMFTIYKDNHGGLWVGTHKHGAYKFNGKAFERFAPPVEPGRTIKPRKNDPYFTPTGARTTPYMPKVIIRNIREDRAGNIWFATFGGPIRYDGKVFTNFAEEVGLATTRIFSLLESRSGATIWFGSITGGATRYDGQTFTKFTEKEGLASNDVHWIFEDRDANTWLGTANGVSRYDGKSFTNFTTNDGLIDNSVYTIGQDAAGRIWFGTQGGICSYDGKSFSNFADQVGRSFSNIRAMAVDRSGTLWFGGEGGAYRYDGKTLTTFTSKDGLLNDFVGSMIVDRAGNVWLGHPGHGVDGGGASRYDGKSFKRFTEKDGLNSGNVYAMLEDSAGNIWFGTVDAGACRYDGKTFTNFSATAP